MRECRINLKSRDLPICVIGYVGHKIRKNGFSEFYGIFRTYYVWNKDIAYYTIDKRVIKEGESDGKET